MDNLAITEKCENVASTLKVLAHPHRLLILCHLLEGEKTVSQLEKICGASQSVVSQHLTRMRLEGILASRREGSSVYYRLEEPKVRKLMQALHDVFCQ